PRRAAAEPEWDWTLRYRGLRLEGGALVTHAAPSEPRARDNRVTYAHEDGVLEWFVNDERGLEHGFTLLAPSAAGGGIVLEVELGGSLVPSVVAEVLELRDSSGARVMRYGGLKAVDARGQTLPASMTLAAIAPSRPLLSLHVDATSGVFPVTVDPLATSASPV